MKERGGSSGGAEVRRGEEEEGKNFDPEGAKGPWLESERRGREGGGHGRTPTEGLLRRNKREQRTQNMEKKQKNFCVKCFGKKTLLEAKSGALKQMFFFSSLRAWQTLESWETPKNTLLCSSTMSRP